MTLVQHLPLTLSDLTLSPQILLLSVLVEAEDLLTSGVKTLAGPVDDVRRASAAWGVRRSFLVKLISVQTSTVLHWCGGCRLAI